MKIKSIYKYMINNFVNGNYTNTVDLVSDLVNIQLEKGKNKYW